MTPERIPLIEYMPYNTQTKVRFVFRAPQQSAGKPLALSINFFKYVIQFNPSSVSNIYTLPFRPSVWFCCLILLLISTVLLYMTSQLEGRTGEKTVQERRFTDSLLSTIAAICQMDPSMQSNVTSSRIIMVRSRK